MEFKIKEAFEIKTKDNKKYQGVIIDEKPNKIVLKLDSGYNVGIFKKNIKEMKHKTMSQNLKASSDKQKKPTQNKNLPELILIHTGGTIASRVNYKTGGVSALFEPEEIISLFPELGQIARLDSRVVSNMLSENVRFSHINKIVDTIKDSLKSKPKGIIVTHGTDTLHYVAAALSFLIEHPPVPIILVGSQRSSDRPSSDSKYNLLSAANFALKSGAKGVFISFHEKSSEEKCVILKGVNSRKMHTSRRDAFKPINTEPVAYVDLNNYGIHWVSKRGNFDAKGKTKFRKFKSNLKMGMIYVHPSITKEEIGVISKLDGAIILGTGLGHIGLEDENSFVLDEFKKAIKKGTILAMAPQTIFGRINLNIYSTGRQLKEMGVLGHECSMTPETAFIKLAYLLSNFKKEEIPELYHTDLRGELSDRIEYIEEYV